MRLFTPSCRVSGKQASMEVKFADLAVHAEILRDTYNKDIAERHNAFWYADYRKGCGDVKIAVARPFKHTDQQVLYIAGTDDAGDWRYNFDVFGNSYYHSGFYKYAQRVIELLSKHRGILPDSRFPNLVVGHSLGGAAAALISTMWKNMPTAGFKHREYAPFCITFGAPRFARRRFAKKGAALYSEATGRILHLQHKGDVVPRRPGGVGVGNWRLPYFARPGVVWRLPVVGENRVISVASPLAAHSMATYTKTMRQMAKNRNL